MKIGRQEREDGTIISTVMPTFMAWYGNYETAVCFQDGNDFLKGKWVILEGYKTEEEARKGHEKYSKMTREELEALTPIG